MEQTDILVIGGGSAGIQTAVTGKFNYPDKKVTMIKKEQHSLLPCGIPYVFGTLEDTEDNLIPDQIAGVTTKIGEVVSIDKENKYCTLADDSKIEYEKLVLAMGSSPVRPNWLKGVDLENIYTVPKDKEYLDNVLNQLKDCHKIVTIGGGFVGVEVSHELKKSGKDVTLIEKLQRIFRLYFDDELIDLVEKRLESHGIKLVTGIDVKEFLGDKKVSGVLLENGEVIEADAVILAMGYKPNTQLAEKSEIDLNKLGYIIVDEYMRTDYPDIFAVGDCAESRDFFTGKISTIMLASTACAEGKIAGMNLYKLSLLRTFNGTVGMFSTMIGKSSFGVAGMTERSAKEAGFEVVTGMFDLIDKHPSTLPDIHRQGVKLVALPDSGIILGGQVISGPSGGELTNLIGLAIQNKMSVYSILTAQIGTHPLLTAPPTSYPLTKAAEIIAKKISSHRNIKNGN